MLLVFRPLLPPAATASCGAESLFVQVTFSPTLTVALAGLKAKPAIWIFTPPPPLAADPVDWAGDDWPPPPLLPPPLLPPPPQPAASAASAPAVMSRDRMRLIAVLPRHGC